MIPPIPPNQHTDGVDDRTADTIRSGMANGLPVVRTIRPGTMAAFREGDPAIVTMEVPVQTWTVNRATTKAVPFIGDARHEYAVREWKVATSGSDQVAGDSTLYIVQALTAHEVTDQRQRTLARHGRVPSLGEYLNWDRLHR